MAEKLKPQQVIKALKETKGLVYLAAKRLNCDPKTIFNYRQRYPHIDVAIENARAEVVDVAEAKLIQALNNNEPWAIRFFLMTQAKHRGYVERQEVSGKDGAAIQTEDINDTQHVAAIRELAVAIRAAVDRRRRAARGAVAGPE